MQNSTILNYKLLKKIGEGGFAEVWLAEHTRLGTKVAIKVLDRKIIEMDGFKERFLRAAKLLTSLKHPNIVDILDYDDSERYAMIMEYLEGPQLKDYIQQNYNPKEPLAIVPLFLQLLDAVEFIHSKGVIHRDIKPANVIITHPFTRNPKLKLLDFDVAKDLNSENTVTITNQQMGTITYMSPEQIESSKHIDKRSDIYTLGVVLFYVLTGRPAYISQADSQYRLMDKIMKEPLPNLETINPNIPNWAVSILRKATAKKANERYQNCREFKDAIEDGLNDITIITPKKVKKNYPILLIVSILGFLLITASYFFYKNSKSKNISDVEDTPKKNIDTISIIKKQQEKPVINPEVVETSVSEFPEEVKFPEGAEEYIYTVKKNETFLEIALRFNVTFDKLRRFNDNIDTDKIKIGVTKLKIPIQAIHTVGPGDILRVVAVKYNISIEALMAANKKNKNITERGEKLIIPLKNKW